METIENELQQTKQKIDEADFVKWVVDTHRKLHENRKSQIDLAKLIEEWRSINQDVKGQKYKDAKFSTMCFIDKAQVANESWTNIEQVYSVNIADNETPVEQAQEQTKLQKYALNHAMKENKSVKQFDKTYDFYQQWGEMISSIGWKQKTITRKFADITNPSGFTEVQVEEDNVNMQTVDPMFFEFDTASYKEDNWDSVIKIHKRFETVEKILNAKYFDEMTGSQVNIYKLSKEAVEELKQEESKIEDNAKPSELATKTIYGNAYEVLLLHGDFKFGGKEYKNYIAEVFAGKYLIRFCPNPYYITPFVIEIPEIDPVTKRGIAKMKSTIYSCMQRQDEINQSFKLGELNTNPPVVGSKSAIKQMLKGKDSGTIEWQPGMAIGVENFTTVNEMKPVTFTSDYTDRNIAFVSNEISDNGGINANAMGNVEKQDRKATDLNLAKAGQDTRLGQTLDSVYKFIIKNIEAMGEILAIFKYGTETIRIFDKKEQTEKLVEITDVVRRAKYQYEYQDRNAITAERSKIEQVYPLLEKGAEAGIVDAKEALKMILEVYGFDNTDKVFMPDDMLGQTIQTIPPEMRDVVAQQIQQIMALAQQQPIMEGVPDVVQPY